MLFRFHHRQLGGHVHVRLFVGKSANHTLANSGSLCFNPEEFEALKRFIVGAAVEAPQPECDFEFLEDHERSLDP